MKIHNRNNLRECRKALRNNATKAECMLWKAISRRRLNGRKFRRQQSIANYVVDFYCPEERLIVELDGDSHFNFVNQNYDDLRTRDLQKFGFRVLRFENRLVFEQMDMILEAISAEFKENKE